MDVVVDGLKVAALTAGVHIVEPREAAGALIRTPIVDQRKTRANRPSHTGARFSGVIYRQVPGVTTQLVQLKL